MIPSGVTWSGPSIDDTEVFVDLPAPLTLLLLEKNGFIVRNGALHVRGAVLEPSWHSLRHAWHGESALSTLYDEVRPTDVPFAEDMLGDQFLLREGRVVRLEAETGEIEPLAESLEEFLLCVEHDIEEYLHLSLSRSIEPGTLLLASPPFCVDSGVMGYDLTAAPATEVIHFHADIARQIRPLPDGTKVELVIDEQQDGDTESQPPQTNDE